MALACQPITNNHQLSFSSSKKLFVFFFNHSLTLFFNKIKSTCYQSTSLLHIYLRIKDLSFIKILECFQEIPLHGVSAWSLRSTLLEISNQAWKSVPLFLGNFPFFRATLHLKLPKVWDWDRSLLARSGSKYLLMTLGTFSALSIQSQSNSLSTFGLHTWSYDGFIFVTFLRGVILPDENAQTANPHLSPLSNVRVEIFWRLWLLRNPRNVQTHLLSVQVLIHEKFHLPSLSTAFLLEGIFYFYFQSLLLMGLFLSMSMSWGAEIPHLKDKNTRETLEEGFKVSER